MTKARSNATAPAAKGQLVVGDGTDSSATLAVGSNNTVLTADSSTATGLKWAAPSSPAYVGYRGRNTGNTTVGNSTYVEYTMNSESWDTDGFHSTTTNTGRVTIPTGKGGKYLVVWGSGWAAGFNTDCIVRNVLYVNGAQTEPFFEVASSTANLEGAPYGSQVMQLNDGDYLQLYYWQNSGSNKTLGNSGYLSVTYLGA